MPVFWQVCKYHNNLARGAAPDYPSRAFYDRGEEA